jgi:hypothetical protein
MSDTNLDNYEKAFGWIMCATRRSDTWVHGLGLTVRQVYLLGGALEENALLNPPKAQVKGYFGVCRDCGSTFERPYRTNRPVLCLDCAKRRKGK